jgi:hypothetical protein
MQKGVLNFIVKPKNKRNESVKKIGESELILNSDLQDHRYVSRIGIIVSVPLKNETDVQVGDEVIVHHNVFRRFYDVRGNEKNSRSYFKEDCFFVSEDQIFAYKRNGEWKAIDGYCFVKPIHSEDKLNIEKEKPLTGVLKFLNKDLISIGLNKEDIVGFSPRSEYEFVIEGDRLYRVKSNSITIKYERKGNEREYNPSWT